MANLINITNEESFNNPYSIDRIESIKSFVNEILEFQSFENWDVSILFCSDDFIQNLNNEYRNINSPTDVLSFEQSEYYVGEDNQKYFFAGDIIISDETLTTNSSKFGIDKDDELKRLLIHGILHLSGMDHGEFHVDINSNILDGESNIVNIDDSAKENPKINMLLLQESIFSKFKDKNIIGE